MKLLLLTFVCVVQMSHFLNWKCGSTCQPTLPLPLTLTLTCRGASAEASSPWKSVTQAGVMLFVLVYWEGWKAEAFSWNCLQTILE